MYELTGGELVFKKSRGEEVRIPNDGEFGIFWDSTADSSLLLGHGNGEDVRKRFNNLMKSFIQSGLDTDCLQIMCVKVQNIDAGMIDCINRYISVSGSISSINNDMARFGSNSLNPPTPFSA